jgi:hypothetical protein
VKLVLAGLLGVAALALATLERSTASSTRASGGACSKPVGAVQTVHGRRAKVNTRPITGFVTLHQNDRVQAGKKTRIDLCLKQKQKTASCRTRSNAALRVEPTSRLLVVWEQGTTTCITNGQGPGQGLTKRHARLRWKDPLFVVKVSRKNSVVKVVKGAVEVRGTAQKAVVVGPRQQATVPSRGAPSKPAPIVLSGLEQSSVAALESKALPPDFSRPSADGSKTLLQIYDQGQFKVGVDSDPTKRLRAFGFTSMFFSFLGAPAQWNVTAKSDYESEKLATRDLGGRITLFATAQPAAVKTALWRLPFFVDPRGTTWYLVGRSDTAFRTAICHFILTTVQSGDYRRLYKGAFKKLPSYTVFDPLISPGARC